MIRTEKISLRGALDLAGMGGDAKYPGKPLMKPAAVTLDDRRQNLIWRASMETVRPPVDLLFSFLRLAEADPEQIRAFAGEWGPLDLCKHGEPGGHIRPHVARSWILRRCSPPAVEGKESLEHWRRISRVLASVLRIAAQLRSDDLGKPSDWERLVPAEEYRAALINVQAQKMKLMWFVERLHVQGGVIHSPEWDSREPQLTWGGNGLFGAIVVQLTLRIAAIQRFFTCHNCGLPDWRTETESRGVIGDN